MNTVFPNLLIGVAALVVAFGAYIGQLGWNMATEAKQRIEMVRNLAETNSANFSTLSAIVVAESNSQQRAEPVETELLALALAGGIFADSEYGSLRRSLRTARAALEKYNYAVIHTAQAGAWASGPRDFSGTLGRALAETRSLGDILGAAPYNQPNRTSSK